jgi:serine/threonine-protein kinase
MNLEPGLRVTESIELESLLAEGGMGQIWAAEHLLLRRRVAVKFLSVSLADDIGALQRFTLEAQTVARLASPHVPQVFDHGNMADGTPYIVMELLEGIDLQRRLRNGDFPSLEQTVQIVRQVCSGLSSAHALGIVHRDIKPENIFLVPENEGFTTKLVDFGVAKSTTQAAVGGLTRTGATIGTPWYMSPEQILNATDVDAGSDMWSLAVVTYCCLTGVLPFPGDTFGAVCFAIHSGVFADPSSIRADLPPALDAWFRKALSQPRDARFASAAEMAAAFTAAALASDAAWPPPPAPSEVALPIPLTRRRAPGGHVLGGIVASLLVASAAAFGAFGAPDNVRNRAEGLEGEVSAWVASTDSSLWSTSR